ncbi:MAG: hypothetical protein LLG06_04105 [Desulfobacteraceae bacterium]|nr:hypothetical protein [Desulfobacteraceae bacterium]
MERIAYLSVYTDKSPQELFNNKVLCTTPDEPDTPYLKLHISVMRHETRYAGNRLDPASTRRQRVAKIRSAITALVKAFRREA